MQGSAQQRRRRVAVRDGDSERYEAPDQSYEESKTRKHRAGSRSCRSSAVMCIRSFAVGVPCLPGASFAELSTRQRKRSKQLAASVVGVSILTVVLLSSSDASDGRGGLLRGRRGRDAARRRRAVEEQLPILIGSLTSGRRRLAFQLPYGALSDRDEPDYGDLVYTTHDKGSARNNEDDRELEKKKRRRKKEERRKEEKESGSFDSYYAFDDDYERDPECRRVSWHRLYHPNCNEFHTVDFLEERNSYISHGFYRDVFASPDPVGEDAVMKLNRIKKIKFDVDSLEKVRMDALVMERLTASPRIVDIYGHCAFSVLTESLPGEIEEYAVPGEGHMAQEELDKNFGPQNDFGPDLKLELALGMAESLADLHGFKDGVIVHDDVQLGQFLLSKDGKLKLNDFNRAEVMLWNDEEERFCKYENGGGYGNYRAPEEWADEPLYEQIDTFSFGNNVYGLLTGLEPFYDFDDDEVVQKNMKDGDTSFIDDRYRHRSFAEGKLVELIEMCWEFDPEDRISIFEAVEFLRDAVAENGGGLGDINLNALVVPAVASGSGDEIS